MKTKLIYFISISKKLQLFHFLFQRFTHNYLNIQKEERARGELGFGGTVPCAQTKGLDHQTFYFEGQHPADILRLGHYEHMPILYGANSHEGSYVYGGIFYAITQYL